MLEIKVNEKGVVERLFTKGPVERVAVGVATAVAMIYASLHATNPDAAAQFRDTLRTVLQDDSYAWDANDVKNHMVDTTCVVTKRERGNQDDNGV